MPGLLDALHTQGMMYPRQLHHALRYIHVFDVHAETMLAWTRMNGNIIGTGVLAADRQLYEQWHPLHPTDEKCPGAINWSLPKPAAT